VAITISLTSTPGGRIQSDGGKPERILETPVLEIFRWVWLFGLAGPAGNHGEDVREYYFYLDSTPTHSYMRPIVSFCPLKIMFPFTRTVLVFFIAGLHFIVPRARRTLGAYRIPR
jgi:hypothetical protein